MSDVWTRVREAFEAHEKANRLRRDRSEGQGVCENIEGQAGTGAGSIAQDPKKIEFFK